MYIHIPYPFTCGSKTRKLPNNTGSNFKPLLTLLERRSQEWGRDGWFLYSPTLFFQSLYFLFSTTHHFVALQQLQQPPCIWVQQARWSQQPTISVAFCSKGRMIVYDKFIRIQSGHMIQSLLLPSRWRWLSLCRMWIPFLFLIFVFAPDIVQLLSSHGYKFTGKPKLWFRWGALLDCEMD